MLASHLVTHPEQNRYQITDSTHRHNALEHTCLLNLSAAIIESVTTFPYNATQKLH